MDTIIKTQYIDTNFHKWLDAYLQECVGAEYNSLKNKFQLGMDDH